MKKTRKQPVLPSNKSVPNDISLQYIVDTTSPGEPGSYCLGIGEKPILITKNEQAVLATASKTCDYLTDLGLTAGITSYVMSSGKVPVAIITESPSLWHGNWSRVYTPEQASLILNRLKKWQPAPHEYLLLILDKITNSWGITPESVAALSRQMGIMVLISGLPDYIAPLAQTIPSASMVIGRLTKSHYSKVLGHISQPRATLGGGRFAIRRLGQWEVFSTTTQY